jgi:K+-sensing histidine kinase KdpD
LSIVKTIVELHGGTIEAHSNGLGQGSLFVARFPALPSKEMAKTGHKQAQLEAAAHLRMLAAKR